MIALDTNILTRYLLNDDPMQAQAAVKLLGSGEPLFVPTTVWLELAWVLGCYDCTREEIAGAVRHVLGLPNLQTMDAIALLRALAGYEGGLDFADAPASCPFLGNRQHGFIRQGFRENRQAF